MVLMHNIILRGLNTIYNQASHVKPDGHDDFFGYSLCWCEVYENHARGEEMHMFPEIDKAAGEKGLMDFDKHDHDLIQTSLTAQKTHLLTLKSSPKTYTPTPLLPLLPLLPTLATPLTTHLTNEIPQLLSLSRFGSSLPILTICTSASKTMTQELDKERGFMFFLLNNDATFEEGRWVKWRPIPSLARWGLVKKNLGAHKG